MAVTPEEASQMTRIESDVVTALENKIDKHIRDQFTSDTKSIIYEMQGALIPRVAQKIKEIYQKAGWDVEYACFENNSRLQFIPVIKR